MTTSNISISIPKNQILSTFDALIAAAPCGFDWLSPTQQPAAIFKPALNEVCGSSRGACRACQAGNCCGRCWCCYGPWPTVKVQPETFGYTTRLAAQVAGFVQAFATNRARPNTAWLGGRR